jgi:hypothetical protein
MTGGGVCIVVIIAAGSVFEYVGEIETRHDGIGDRGDGYYLFYLTDELK